MKKIQQTEEIKAEISSQESSKRKICWAMVVLSVLWLISVAITLWFLWLAERKTPLDLIMTVFVVSILTIVLLACIRPLTKCIVEKEQEAKRWRTILLDAYGNLLEEEVRSIKNEYGETVKKQTNNPSCTKIPKNEAQNSK